MTGPGDWRHTRWGAAVRFVGSLRLAIPVMALVVIAMIAGATLDATFGGDAAARFVYATGWFIGLMGVIALSLIASVATRYPWKQRHTGFITVHAGLLILIVGGFWSLFARVEGRVILREGDSAGVAELYAPRLELLDAGGSAVRPVSSVRAGDDRRGRVRLGPLTLTILDRWPDTREEATIADDGDEPLRAFRVVTTSTGDSGRWIAQASRTGGPVRLDSFNIVVLGEGEAWSAPGSDPLSIYRIVDGGQRAALPDVGEEAAPGWRVLAIHHFAAAIATGEGLVEDDNPAAPNPAIEVLLSDGAGTVERLTAFERFPGMSMRRRAQGEADSGLQIEVVSGAEKLTLFGQPGALRAVYTDAAGNVQRSEHGGALPWTIRAGGDELTIVEQATHAHATTRFVAAPVTSDKPRPALLVQMEDGRQLPIPWKSAVPVGLDGRLLRLRYGPGSVSLPFAIRLDDFRRTDYPGTTMAMSYASDVVATSDSGDERRATITLNRPLSIAGWKVYQSGFEGDTVAVFTVARDPAMPLVYAGCVVLIVGIVLTFYGGKFSRGHPGVSGAGATGDETP
ncbi:MAG: cytochrome c biogenesis protein ResB [Phycisphaeraceae bacterium]|nr:cytochrome c biogenesis protein ResB [Phycisphaeraceae bacterium]MCB9848654.1 cytochrome c biogenesis protein ResB [Phycisphaeraceae bacterium]